MTAHTDRYSAQSAMVRAVLAGVWVYFAASMAMAAVLLAVWRMDWQPLSDYALLLLLILMVASFVVYPAAQMIIFRAPRWCADAIDIKMFVSIFAITIASCAMAGTAYLPMAGIYLATMLFFLFQHRAKRRHEAGRPPA